MSETKEAAAPIPLWFLKGFTKFNVFVYKVSSGRFMSKLAGMPICLVEMKGAKTGKTRTIPLMHVPSGDKVILVASQGGAPKNPVWYYNLMKYPEVRITEGGVTRNLVARKVGDEEKLKLWPTCLEYYPPYQEYQERTERNIPVFICESV